VKSSKAKILVVDDDAGVRGVIVRFLQGGGHEVECVSSGEEAVSRLDDGYDIVVTDLRLSGAIDGNEVTRRFRASGVTDVVIMTGHPGVESAIEGLRGEAYDYLIKPISRDYLLTVITRCLEKRRLSADLAREKALRVKLRGAYLELSVLNRVREIFGQFATPEVARVAMTHPGDMRTRGERRCVTVLFADVRGFTAYSAEVPPEQVTADLNEIFTILQEQIHAEGGILNKFLGDGAMALFGAPLSLEHHEAAAVRTALGIQRAMADLGLRRSLKGQAPLGLGIGINTGDVVAGCLGSKERTEYSVIGSPINLAARMVQIAKPGQILVGQGTLKALGAEFETRDCGMMSFHGFKDQVPVSAVLGLKAAGAVPLADNPALAGHDG
jgi:class 3 adenylate cyclase/CheY-like chemotaxis protein